MISRDDIIGLLRDDLARVELFRAAWLGGSDANGRVDALSDIDLVAFVGQGRADEGLSIIRSTLERLALIEREWRLPSPTWHGGEQTFFQLSGCPNFGLVDAVLMTHTPGFEFFVRERHGDPAVLFDHDGLVSRTPLDRSAHGQRVRERVETARGKFTLLSHLAAKEARRDRPIDAIQYYESIVISPLVDVLRAVHCPDRFDFGLRYLRDDLPAEAYSSVERLVYPASADELAGMTEAARAMMGGALAQWDARKPG